MLIAVVSKAQDLNIIGLGGTFRDTYSIEYCNVEDTFVVCVEVSLRDFPMGIKGENDDEAKWDEYPENVLKTKHFYTGLEFGVGRKLRNWIIIGSVGYYARCKIRNWYDPEEELGDKGYYYNIFNASHNKISLGIKVKYLIPLNKKGVFWALGAKFSSFDGVGLNLGVAF